MKKSLLCAVVIFMLTLPLSGCDNPLSVEFPDNPVMLVDYEIDLDGDGIPYRAFDYNGRTYIPYAEVFSSKAEIADCIGMLLQDDEAEDVGEKARVWILRLKAFENEDILMEYTPYVSHMEHEFCYRAIDTKGQTLEMPDYISDNIGEYWK